MPKIANYNQIEAHNRGNAVYEMFANGPYIQEHVKRSGNIISGMYGEANRRKYELNPESRFPSTREQSVAEHEHEAVDLFFDIRDIYGDEVFGGIDLLLLVEILHRHDAGEAVHGDIPDDGSQRQESANDDENEFMDKNIYNNIEVYGTGAAHANELRSGHIAMEHKSSLLGIVAKLIDKTVAVLYDLKAQESGHGGDLKNKKNLSDLDKLSIKITGSTRVADVWLCSSLLGHPELMTIPLTLVCFEIIQAASIRVRGEKMAWLNDFLVEWLLNGETFTLTLKA
ncbi:hypothetical protein IKX64_03210 [Candidatus Saccharibacteria bacterium]|nr:hypothetical protein [Candidatus Saccharibacteria bacterium]